RGEATMANGYERALLIGLQFPADSSCRFSGPTRNPGVCNQAGLIQFQNFAVNLKRAAIWARSAAAPFAANAQICFKIRTPVDTDLPPPLHHFCRIHKSLKNTLRRSGDLNFA